MENILLVVNLVLATILVLLILVQKSEGGALGMVFLKTILCFPDLLVILWARLQQ